MTKNECIEAIKALDIEHNCSADELILEQLYEIVHSYDPSLDYFFDKFFTEEHVFNNIWENCHNVEEIADRIRYITEYTGLYYDGEYGWETANLYRLRDGILSELEKDDQCIEPTPLSEKTDIKKRRMSKKLTKKELIDILQSDEYLKYSGDALCDWLLDLKYAYVEPYQDEELDELFQRYWSPEDIEDYLVSKLTNPNIEPLDALAEVRGLLYYKEGDTYWSYFDTEEETDFNDVNDEDLHQLRLRMLEVLTREEKDD